MTQRFWDNLSVVVLAIVATTGGTYFGMREGRAEMKRWQDSYYQAHPVVKEVHETWYPVSTVPACKVGEYLSYTTSEWKCIPAPPKKAKPAKAKCEPPSCSGTSNGPLYDSDGRLVWMGGSTGSITLPAEREIYCDSSVAPGDGWLPLTSAPHDGTIVEIAETYGYTPWYDFYQFVDGGWKQASNHAYGLNGEKCGYWRPRRTAPTRSDN